MPAAAPADTGLSLFHVLNLIVEEQITKPNTGKALFDSLPQNARDAIEKRDATTCTPALPPLSTSTFPFAPLRSFSLPSHFTPPTALARRESVAV
jgi:hypothetical protein